MGENQYKFILRLIMLQIENVGEVRPVTYSSRYQTTCSEVT
jgi:hypothetical protein